MLIELMIQYTQVELNNLPYSVAEVLAKVDNLASKAR